MKFRVVYTLGMIAAVGALDSVGSVHAQEATLTLEDYLMMSGPTYFCQVRDFDDDKSETLDRNDYFSVQREPVKRTRLVRRLEVAERILDDGGYIGPCAVYGDRRSIGDGYFQTYVGH